MNLRFAQGKLTAMLIICMAVTTEFLFARLFMKEGKQS